MNLKSIYLFMFTSAFIYPIIEFPFDFIDGDRQGLDFKTKDR